MKPARLQWSQVQEGQTKRGNEQWTLTSKFPFGMSLSDLKIVVAAALALGLREYKAK